MPRRNSTHLEINITAAEWRKVRGIKARLRKAAAATFTQLPPSLKPVVDCSSFTLLLTTDGVVKKLNRDWRGKNKPTNVLSFPQFSPAQLKKMAEERKLKKPVYMGDIAISCRYVVAEAKKEHKILLDHVTHLMIHGILHIFGYDHTSATQAVKMESMEKKIMASLGLADPYAANGKA